MAKPRRQYTREFKLAAVTRIIEQGRSGAEAARSLGVSAKQLRHGKAVLQQQGQQAFSGHGNLPPADEALRRLREENQRRSPRQTVRREPEDDQGQDGLFGNGGQQQQAQGEAEQRGQHQPPGTAQMDLVPVLHDDHKSDRDGDEDGQGSSDLDRMNQGQQGDGDQRFAEAENRPDQRGDEDHH